MFERSHHRKIERVLRALDSDFLAHARCGFGGGTAIALQLGEYRESVDIDFLCADTDGYRLLRETVSSHSLGAILRETLPLAREIRTHRDKISTYVQVDDTPIRLEFVLEARIRISSQPHAQLHVPVLERQDLFAEKLLANADRGLDRSQRSRDLIDIAYMITNWGPIPKTAVEKATGAYGDAVFRYFDQVLEMLRDPAYLESCLSAMAMPIDAGPAILHALESQHFNRSLIRNAPGR